jgi:hypothetical protein
MSATDTNLEEKRAKLDAQLVNLKMSPSAADLVRAADQAVAQYRADADALERELAVVDAELDVRENDRRDAAARLKQEQWLARRKAIVEESEVRLQAVEDCERATRALVQALERILANNARMKDLAVALSVDGKAPMALNPMELVARMAGRIAAVMSTVKDHRHQFGSLIWPSSASALHPTNGPTWRQSEESLLTRQLLEPLLSKGKA